MDVGAVNNNILDIQSLLINQTKCSNCVNNGYDTSDRTADYAKKGEPMYMVEMDKDEDGTVTLDEFQDYCKSNGISSRQMVKMAQLSSSYRTLKAETEAIDYISKLLPNVFPKLKQADSDSAHINNNENKYNLSTDSSVENRVSYKEYMEYCEQNVEPNSFKADSKVSETDSGNLKVLNYGKAAESYGANKEHNLENTFEEVV